MLKPILEFGLTRRPIIVLSVMVFIAAGLFAFTRLNIEAQQFLQSIGLDGIYNL